MKLWRLILRATIGALFVGHGTQKLFGWFGGDGIEGTGDMFESLGLKPGNRNAIAAGVAEAVGGALIAAGTAMPLAGAALTGTMVTAVRHVHAPKGPWVTDGGYEYNAVLIAAALALVEEDSGPAWALAAFAAGVGGSFTASWLAQREVAREMELPEAVAVPFERAPAREREPVT